MKETIEIYVIFPKHLKIHVPQQLLEEFDHVVKEEDLSEIITEAINEELKKIRFRMALQRTSKQLP